MVLTKPSRSKVWKRTDEKQIKFLSSYLKSNPLALALFNMKEAFSQDIPPSIFWFSLERCASPPRGLAIL